MTAGGGVLIGTTVAIAWLDGGLTAMIVGTAVGGATYYAARRNLASIPARVLAQQKAAIELGDPDPKSVKRRVKALEAKSAGEGRWNKELAAGVAVAGFACPVIGMAAIAAMTSNVWKPKQYTPAEGVQDIIKELQ